MTVQRNIGALSAVADPEDISIGTLLEVLDNLADLPLVFCYDDREIRSGYHVTEVKAGRFEALDCGANPESWTEIFVQLWDANEEQAQMSARKFAKIIRKVTEHVALDPHAKLTFEVSDGLRPMQLYRAALPALENGTIRVSLSPRPASCKPRDRWLQQQTCCAATANSTSCCG